METTVSEVMTAPVLTVDADEQLVGVAETMAEAAVNSVVVVEDSEPAGILTSTDYVAMTADGVDPHQNTVEEYLSTEVVTVAPDADLSTAAELMTAHGISHLPVVADDQIVGIVSDTDLTEHLAAPG